MIIISRLTIRRIWDLTVALRKVETLPQMNSCRNGQSGQRITARHGGAGGGAGGGADGGADGAGGGGAGDGVKGR